MLRHESLAMALPEPDVSAKQKESQSVGEPEWRALTWRQRITLEPVYVNRGRRTRKWQSSKASRKSTEHACITRWREKGTP